MNIVILIALAGFILLFLVVFIYLLVKNKSSNSFSNLRQASQFVDYAGERMALEEERSDSENIEDKINKRARRSRRRRKKQEVLSLDDRLYRAGIFSEEARTRFNRTKVLSPIIGLGGGLAVGIFFFSGILMIAPIFLGLLCGMQLPNSILDRKAKARSEDVLYYLPLIIEEVAIGVSSSLDIGPCLQRVVKMADERENHNVVTELISHVLYNVKTGISLEEALGMVGLKSGQTEVQQAFTALAQVSKHGGEISKQLQELANAISTQRETAIEAKVKKLELKATGPVALVFLAFIAVLMSGFFLQIVESMQSM